MEYSNLGKTGLKISALCMGTMQFGWSVGEFEVLDTLDEIAAAHGATITQVSLAWLLAAPLISSPIIGATSVKQLDENLGALDVKLTGEERRKIDKLTAWA